MLLSGSRRFSMVLSGYCRFSMFSCGSHRFSVGSQWFSVSSRSVLSRFS